jgi:nucleoside-diphosphate-sugar epimerase
VKILIIGGTGLISTSITRQLLERGDDVTLYNRGQREARIPPAAKRILGDRSNYAAFEAQMRQAGEFDCVIDMIGFVPEEEQSTVRAFKGRIGQFIFCSTVDVYSKPIRCYPYREDAPRNAVGSYGQNKVLCEDVLMEAHRRGDFAVTIIRPAYTYGESGSLIHTFGWSTTHIDRLRKGKPIVVHGDGSSLWVCCHVDDLARAFVNAAGNRVAFSRAYHVTGEEWMTWNEYHRTVAEAIGAPGPTLVHIPTDLLVRVAPNRAAWCGFNFQFNNIFDNSAARADLSFRYTIPFLEGARRTVAWLDERGRIEDSDKDPFYDRLLAAWERLGQGMVEARLEGDDA